MAATKSDYTVVVIGSGFGGSMTALSLAREFDRRGRGENVKILERGTWWTTPVGTVQDKEVRTFEFLQKDNKQPVQYWPSVEHFKGLIDLYRRCFRRKNNEDGLYDLTTFGRPGFLGLFGGEHDGVTIMRACGVGGGSLVYSNITIQPPDFVLQDARWPFAWSDAFRRELYDYYELARRAIGYGVLFALNNRGGPAPDVNQVPPGAVNTGLSNIATRSAHLSARWRTVQDPILERPVNQIDLTAAQGVDDPNHDLWIDRARVFQKAMNDIEADLFGTVDSSINDIRSETGPFGPLDGNRRPKNYCERQGRCNVGCLPGARHTLNKQLMNAIFGNVPPPGQEPTPALASRPLAIEALAEVDVVRARDGGGYEVHYLTRDAVTPSKTTRHVVSADKVILAAGCVGTTEILLRSRAAGALPHLSDSVGTRFSTNGDYLAFLDGTAERAGLHRGPVTTSFAHFNTRRSTDRFHTLEDQGIPRSTSTLLGWGMPILRALSRGRGNRHETLALVWHLKGPAWRWLKNYARAIFSDDDAERRNGVFRSEDEVTANMICVVGAGRDQADGVFRLGKRGETTLRVQRASGEPFHKDPIYTEIRASLQDAAAKLSATGKGQFVNPFVTLAGGAPALVAPVALTHALGGCPMGTDAAHGAVDQYGRVFDTSRPGGLYDGLYVADASIIPTGLGVNPSLTISALALRIADNVVKELPAEAAAPAAPAPGAAGPT